MISTVIEASRSWSSSLNRTGWGCLVATIFAWSFGFPTTELFSVTGSGFAGGEFLVASLLFLLASALLGSMAISLGSVGDRQGFSIERRTLLAERIGSLNNPVLIQLLADASLRYELAAGARGTLLFAGLAAFNFWLSGSSETPIDFSVRGPTWAISSGIVLAIVFNWLLGISSSELFNALEKAVATAERRAAPTSASVPNGTEATP